ncbi:MAG: NPCBM/NEW2 domain-containing protein [Candidatus Hydrogenedentes bacterium]|nr:NPCBM/NEW2 domain-containing protein [Candidatus Hydrogenedentota bacterium]
MWAIFVNVVLAATTEGVAPDTVTIEQVDRSLSVSVQSPQFVFEAGTVGGGAPSGMQGQAIAGGQPVEYDFPSAAVPGGGRFEIRLFVQWSAEEQVLRKWARFRLTQSSNTLLLQEIVLDDIDPGAQPVQTFPGDVQSYPVFLEGLFVGVEFPIASTREEQGRIVLAHRPGLRVSPETWYESRRAVYGLTPKGRELQGFHEYILKHRPSPLQFHVNYNSWWTAPAPYYTEQDILSLMAVFENRLFKAHGVALDTFCIDMGWSNKDSIWEIDPRLFPEGFSGIRAAAERMKCRPGLWISPSSCYPTALDGVWARTNRYETLGNNLCLGGPRYRDAFVRRVTEYAERYGVRHFKLDGYIPTCPEAGHGHAPGTLSAEAVAEGIIAAAHATRETSPEVWLEPTCFGWNPSPWWLFHFDSVIGSFGDDAPHGRVPAPVYRESYTTARDFYNLQGAYWSPVPQAGQEVLGIIHQTPEPFLNDGVMTIMRGHYFLPLYVNPKHMDDRRWATLAALLTWARTNADTLAETVPLLPESWRTGGCPRFQEEAIMPREPYGYGHCKDGHGLIALRNPWIRPQTYGLALNESAGMQPSETELNVVSVYPESRVYARNIKYGEALEIPLAPYETVVLSVTSEPPPAELPEAADCVLGQVRRGRVRLKTKRCIYDGPAGAIGPDWTSLVGEATEGTSLTLDTKVNLKSPQGDVLILSDGSAEFHDHCALRINGRKAELVPTGSATGWAATGRDRPEHWTFLRAPLEPGTNRIHLDLLQTSGAGKLSAWVWAYRSGTTAGATASNALPEPEIVSLDAAVLLESTALAEITAPEPRHAPRPVERIDGVFLDALQPVSALQGFGTLQRNRSVWEKSMTIAGKLYRRGLGTHSPAQLVYALEGKYQRFQSWVGADGAVQPTITFEVRVDGETRFGSGLMQRDNPAQWVDVEVRGARTLELIVGDGGNGITADHANWAEARLLR